MSEITQLICAHCGAKNAVSNRINNEAFPPIPPSPLALNDYNQLIFNCHECKTSYPLVSDAFQQAVEKKDQMTDLLNMMNTSQMIAMVVISLRRKKDGVDVGSEYLAEAVRHCDKALVALNQLNNLYTTDQLASFDKPPDGSLVTH